MTQTIRLTAAKAMVKWLSVQFNEDGDRYIDGVWGIFGHGNVAGLGEALYNAADTMPTWRGQNEQTMAHTAIAYAKTLKRKRAQAVTSVLINAGVPAMRIQSAGRGENQPVADNLTPQGRAQNRRVEIIIIPTN